MQRRQWRQKPAGICKGIVACMRDRHISNSKVVVLAQDGEGVANLMTPNSHKSNVSHSESDLPFDTYPARNLPGADGPPPFFRRQGELEDLQAVSANHGVETHVHLDIVQWQALLRRFAPGYR